MQSSKHGKIWLGIPLLAAILWIMRSAGTDWAWWAWGVWVGFNLLIFPACRANERFGGPVMMAVGAVEMNDSLKIAVPWR